MLLIRSFPLFILKPATVLAVSILLDSSCTFSIISAMGRIEKKPGGEGEAEVLKVSTSNKFLTDVVSSRPEAAVSRKNRGRVKNF